MVPVAEMVSMANMVVEVIAVPHRPDPFRIVFPVAIHGSTNGWMTAVDWHLDDGGRLRGRRRAGRTAGFFFDRCGHYFQLSHTHSP